ncbi:uncharacterized protein F5891DRAFT_314616 [Suillus fuscotomentosus]|uniref:Uncharacterized protein n=1 Tax=Suillus fuscotomentosus TaxID=1912939 RepID=A0AAD4E8T6_9AGAM|nr:uncharacterized protein F5891DRAFT_314616 [Suillus fuscotomentosus]KAG1900438.1 hypothetical protein F5891DRAFT_314616 [Suillus fuscotomentosus]
MDATEKQQLRNHFHLASSESPVCNVISYQPLSRAGWQYLWLICRFHAHSRSGSIISLYMWQAHNLVLQSCPKYTMSRQLFIFLQQFVICVILIIRTYALYNRNKRLIIWVTFILIVLAGGASATTFGQYEGNLMISPGVGCFTTYTVEISARSGLAWLAILAFEALIFVLTVYRICKSRGLSRLRLVTRRNILDVMFHDGVMYFGAMTLCNIPNIVMFYYGSAAIRGNVGLATFTSCMSVTLISRLILNLHKSVDSGILSVPAQDDDYCLSVFTTSISIQSAIA